MKLKTTNCQIILSLIILLIISDAISATGVLYVRPRGSSQTYQKMWIKKIDVDVEIRGQVAVTHVDQTFYNELNQSVESIYIFPLPANAMVTELYYWLDGVRYKAEIRERQDAQNAYNQQLQQWLDPAMLEYLGDNMFRLSIVPIPAQSEVRTEITYAEILPYDFGITKYEYKLNTLGLSSKALETVSLRLNSKSQNPYKYFTSPSHNSDAATSLTKVSTNEYELFYGDENFYPDKNLQIEFETLRERVQFNLLTYSPTEEDGFGDDNFYATWVTPPDSIVNEKIIPKDIVFTADVSSSMDGERLSQLKQSLRTFINLLNENDRFNIITFGTHIVKYKDSLVSVNSDNIGDALKFVDNLYALGMTNISGALEESLSQNFGDESSNNLIFLTDGLPTLGVTNANEIIEKVNEANLSNIRLFSFGIGDNLNRRLLTEISMENSGYAKFIEQDEDIAFTIGQHFKRISKPILSDIEIDYGGLDAWDIYPKNSVDLFWGSRYVKMGLYKSTGEFRVQIKGNYLNQEQSFNQNLFFPDSGGFRAVAILWARAKIDHLLELIEIYGETDELVQQVTDLSLRFQILTEYTAFYIDPTKIENDEIVSPKEYKLWQNYPNPFNPSTTIKFTLPKVTYVTVKVYDILGREIAILVDGLKNAGTFEVNFDGAGLASGIYFCMIKAGDFSQTMKMVLNK